MRRAPPPPVLQGACCAAGLTGGRCASLSPEDVRRAGLTGSGRAATSGATGLRRLAPAAIREATRVTARKSYKTNTRRAAPPGLVGSSHIDFSGSPPCSACLRVHKNAVVALQLLSQRGRFKHDGSRSPGRGRRDGMVGGSVPAGAPPASRGELAGRGELSVEG